MCFCFHSSLCWSCFTVALCLNVFFSVTFTHGFTAAEAFSGLVVQSVGFGKHVAGTVQHGVAFHRDRHVWPRL